MTKLLRIFFFLLFFLVKGNQSKGFWTAKEKNKSLLKCSINFVVKYPILSCFSLTSLFIVAKNTNELLQLSRKTNNAFAKAKILNNSDSRSDTPVKTNPTNISTNSANVGKLIKYQFIKLIYKLWPSEVTCSIKWNKNE